MAVYEMASKIFGWYACPGINCITKNVEYRQANMKLRTEETYFVLDLVGCRVSLFQSNGNIKYEVVLQILYWIN